MSEHSNTSHPFFRNSQTEKASTPDKPYHHIAKRPSPEIYKIMKEDGIRTMIWEFYILLHQSPIQEMFSRRPIEESAERSSAFFIQLFGGPQTYRKRYGEPKMRARHLPFRITEKHRIIWRDTFFQVLDHPQNFYFPKEHIEEFKLYLDTFSRWMVNDD